MTWLKMLSFGGAIGFIVANAPGAIAGAVAGNRLGAVRDSKGKSVYSVFQELDQHAGYVPTAVLTQSSWDKNKP